MDPVDQYAAVTEACKPKCATQWTAYEACKARIEKKGHGECEPWYFDYYKCIDKCRVPQFSKITK